MGDSQPLQQERERSAVPAGKEHVVIRLGLFETYDPKLGESRGEWTAEARWWPGHLALMSSGGRRGARASKVSFSADTAEEALEGITRLLVTQWLAVAAQIAGDTVAGS